MGPDFIITRFIAANRDRISVVGNNKPSKHTEEEGNHAVALMSRKLNLGDLPSKSRRVRPSPADRFHLSSPLWE
jgi:hypothetical protein